MNLLRTLALLALVAGVLVYGSCSPRIEEGTTREVRQEGSAGVVLLEGEEVYRDGKWHKTGPFVFRDDQGEVTAQGSYVDGREEGPWEQIVEDGSRGVGEMENGSRTGEWKWYHANLKLQDVGTYDRGLRTGRWLSYRADGTRLREAHYENGKLHGRVLYFGRDGKAIDEERSGMYERGERISPGS